MLTNKNFFYHMFHEIRNYLNIISISGDNLSSIIESIETSNNSSIKTELIDEKETSIRIPEYVGNINKISFSSDKTVDLMSNKTNKKLKKLDITEKNEIIETIDNIKDSSKTIVDIISDVLTLEKLRTNEINIRYAYFMLNDLYQTCFLYMQQSAINKEINFVCENNIGSVSIKGDYIRLKQVIINLLSNAFKFTGNGGKIVFSIDKITLEEKEYIKFSVTDNGIGIKEKNYGLIFRDFQQIEAENQQKGGGTGLGLSIAKIIVEKHNGFINFTSEYNKGSTFYFMVPFIELKLTVNNDLNYDKTKTYKRSPVTNIRTVVQENKQLDFSKLKILFVDDNKTIQKIFLKTLNNMDIENVIIASNGEEGYQIYVNEYNKNCSFDIVLLDQEMPIMNGNECCKLITELNKDAIVIGITGNALIEQKTEFINSGAREIYEKPITKEKIVELFTKYFLN